MNGMRKIDGLAVGWLNTNIREIADAGLLSEFQSVLITSIDSTINLAVDAFRRPIAGFDPYYTFLGRGVVVNGKSIASIAARLFTGFDEVWCFDRSPITPLPTALSLVGPLNLEEEPAPNRLLPWMIETDCKLGLGDGVGLNFATPAREIAERLVRLAASL